MLAWEFVIIRVSGDNCIPGKLLFKVFKLFAPFSFVIQIGALFFDRLELTFLLWLNFS